MKGAHNKDIQDFESKKVSHREQSSPCHDRVLGFCVGFNCLTNLSTDGLCTIQLTIRIYQVHETSNSVHIYLTEQRSWDSKVGP